MYTLTINSVYQNTWTERFNSLRALKKAARDLWRNMSFGEVINTYAPDGTLISSRTR